jgi:hypothetical protein
LIRVVARHNLGILMRKMTGASTPKEAAACSRLLLIVVYTEETLAIFFLAIAARSGEDNCSVLILAITPEPA